MERAWTRMGSLPAAGPGFGGLFAGSLLASMAGSVLGTAIAHQFFAHDPQAGHLFGSTADGGPAATGDLADDPWQNLDVDSGGAGLDDGFDGGSFDI
jgi:hypothetical protein